MTREEAIKVIKSIIDVEQEYGGKDNIDALNMAIQALSQEPCDDATLKDIFCMGCEYREQEHKSGEWINDENHIPICNKCGYIPPYDRAIDDYEYSNYCPNCGCRMVEPQESEDKE